MSDAVLKNGFWEWTAPGGEVIKTPAAETLLPDERKGKSYHDWLETHHGAEHSRANPDGNPELSLWPERAYTNDSELASLIKETLENCISLSPKQREVVSLLAQGYSLDAVAGMLRTTKGTVEVHLRRARAKLS